jgi:hypothetical protein
MSPAPNPAKQLKAISQPGALRSLRYLVNDNAKRHRALPPAAHPAPPLAPAPPNIDFQEVSRLLQLAKKTLQAEHERILNLKDHISKLRGFEDAYFKNRETIDELRADRDLWRTQAVAMSNWLLTNGQQH